MSQLFLTVLNMSLTASYVILAVILIRLLLKKAPKVISYGLWAIVAFRLICPFSFESIFSLLPQNTAPIPHNIIYEQIPEINSGISNVDQFINKRLPAASPVASVNPIQIYIGIGAAIWMIGMLGMLLYSFISIIVLNKKIKEAKYLEGDIYEANNFKTPFVLGVIRPKIYLPAGLSGDEKHYILHHEQTLEKHSL